MLLHRWGAPPRGSDIPLVLSNLPYVVLPWRNRQQLRQLRNDEYDWDRNLVYADACRNAKVRGEVAKQFASLILQHREDHHQ